MVISSKQSVTQVATVKERKKYAPDALIAASAEVDAAFLRSLTARRAEMSASNRTVLPVLKMDSLSTLKGKKTSKVMTANSTDSPSISNKGGTTSSQNKVSPLATPPFDDVHLGHTTCPLCLLSPMHEREKCPLVLGGFESLQNRLREIQELSANRGANQNEIIVELQQLLVLAQKDGVQPLKQRSNTRPSPLLDSQETTSPDIRTTGQPSPDGPTTEGGGLNFSSATTATVSTAKEASDSSSDETSDDENLAGDNPVPSISKDASLLVNVNLDDLIRGPILRVADISSPEDSEEEQDQVLEEDQDEIPRYSRKSGMPDSSDDADSGLEDDDHSPITEPLDPSVADDLKPLGPGTDHVSFQAVDKLGESQELDRSADAAFGVALAQDTAVFKLAHSSQNVPPKSPSCLASCSAQTTITSDTAGQEPTFITPLTTTPTFPDATSPPDLAPSTSQKELKENPQPAGIVRRMKTRNFKGCNNDRIQTISKECPTSRAGLSQADQGVPESAVRRTRAVTRLQALGTMTPPTPPKNLGRQSRLIRASEASSMVEGSNVASTHLSDAMSLDTWTILKPSSPIPDGEVTMMVDELESSSPLHSTHMDVDKPEQLLDGPAENPLFLLTESLPPFPYSQWDEVPRKEAENDSISNDSNDENEVEASIRRLPLKPRPSQTIKFRRLTDITSDHGLFSTPTELRPIRASTEGSKKALDMYGRPSEEIESESESDSDDSDAKEQSHIPIGRGAGVRETKGSRTVG